MSEPPPISVVRMLRRRLPDGYALVSKADLETVLNRRVAHAHLRPGVWDDDNGPEKAGKPCLECAAEARLRTALDGRLTDEEQEAWDAYAAERQATAKPDSREAIQALIDASAERVIRTKVAAPFRARAQAGRSAEPSQVTLGAQWDAFQQAQLWDSVADEIERGEQR